MNDTTLLKFPCQFPIKIFGHASLEFQAKVLAIIRKHAPDLGEAAITVNWSNNKKYIAITATINATSKLQIDAIYQELSDCKEVIMAL